jgi:hypothetical protein
MTWEKTQREDTLEKMNVGGEILGRSTCGEFGRKGFLVADRQE